MPEKFYEIPKEVLAEVDETESEDQDITWETLTPPDEQNYGAEGRVAKSADYKLSIPPHASEVLHKALPIPGLDYALIHSSAHSMYALNPEDGYPGTTLCDERGIPMEFLDKELEPMFQALDSAISSQDFRKRVEEVRVILEQKKIMGHSITSPSAHPNAICRGAVNIARFGLWPQLHRYSEPLAREHYPWIGSFGKAMGWTAGDYFSGIAVIPQYNQDTYVELPEEVGGGTFVPPLELVYVVPNTEVKRALQSLVRGRSYDTYDRMGKNIITFDDIINGRQNEEGELEDCLDVLVQQKEVSD